MSPSGDPTRRAEADPALAELLAERTAGLCGYLYYRFRRAGWV